MLSFDTTIPQAVALLFAVLRVRLQRLTAKVAREAPLLRLSIAASRHDWLMASELLSRNQTNLITELCSFRVLARPTSTTSLMHMINQKLAANQKRCARVFHRLCPDQVAGFDELQHGLARMLLLLVYALEQGERLDGCNLQSAKCAMRWRKHPILLSTQIHGVELVVSPILLKIRR